MVVTYVVMIFTILPLARYMSRITVVPTVYMAPIIISFTLVGSFVPRDYIFDMYLALVFGVIGYIARKTGYSVAAILIGVHPRAAAGELLPASRCAFRRATCW